MKIRDFATVDVVIWLPLVTFYTVGLVGVFTPSLETQAMAFINSGQYWTVSESEELGIERLEAFLWLVGCSSFACGAYRAKKLGPRLWLVGFGLMCFVALGEETSWGQHYLGYETPEAIASMNVQNELNVHNTDLAAFFEVSPESQFYPFLGNLTHYLNPLFSLFCLCAWGLVPALIRAQRLRCGAGGSYPLFNLGFYITFLGFAAGYLVIDKMLFDAGELLELTLATAGGCFGLLSAREQYVTQGSIGNHSQF